MLVAQGRVEDSYELPDSLAIGYSAISPWQHAAVAIKPLLVRRVITSVSLKRELVAQLTTTP